MNSMTQALITIRNQFKPLMLNPQSILNININRFDTKIAFLIDTMLGKLKWIVSHNYAKVLPLNLFKRESFWWKSYVVFWTIFWYQKRYSLVSICDNLKIIAHNIKIRRLLCKLDIYFFGIYWSDLPDTLDFKELIFYDESHWGMPSFTLLFGHSPNIPIGFLLHFVAAGNPF